MANSWVYYQVSWRSEVKFGDTAYKFNGYPSRDTIINKLKEVYPDMEDDNIIITSMRKMLKQEYYAFHNIKEK